MSSTGRGLTPLPDYGSPPLPGSRRETLPWRRLSVGRGSRPSVSFSHFRVLPPWIHFLLHFHNPTPTPAATPDPGVLDLSSRPSGSQSHPGRWRAKGGCGGGLLGMEGRRLAGPDERERPFGGGEKVTRLSIQGRCWLWCWWRLCGVAHSHC